jgi:DNA-binding CsgD family transcriptional regulator
MEFSHKNMLPGILTKDVEFYAVGEKNVEVIHDHNFFQFEDLPQFIHDRIRVEMNAADASLEEMEHFVYENYGGLDLEPDINVAGKFSCREYMETREIMDLGNGHHITSCEMKVLKLVDLPDKLIADKLSISTTTVLSHMQNMRAKTGLVNKVELAILATKKGII